MSNGYCRPRYSRHPHPPAIVMCNYAVIKTTSYGTERLLRKGRTQKKRERMMPQTTGKKRAGLKFDKKKDCGNWWIKKLVRYEPL